MRTSVFTLLFVLFLAGSAFPQSDDLDRDHDPVVRIKKLQGRASLVVPKSFAGRSGDEYSEGISIEILNRIEVTRNNLKTRLAGTVNRFDFDTKMDSIKGLVWESRKFFPRKNACMDCHGNGWNKARTQIWLGEDSREFTPKPTVRGSAVITFPTADLQKSYFELKHFFTPNQAVHFGSSSGRMRSFDISQKARSSWLGWTWMNHKNISVISELRQSKAELYESKREFLGKFQWKGKNGFLLGLQGGILLDGFAQYDLGFSDIGAVVVSNEKSSPEYLPTVYTQMKTERFGYYSIQARYEYAF